MTPYSSLENPSFYFCHVYICQTLSCHVSLSPKRLANVRLIPVIHLLNDYPLVIYNILSTVVAAVYKGSHKRE